MKRLPLTVIILTHRSDKRFINSLASAQKAAEVLILDYDSKNDWVSLKKTYHFKKITRSGPIENFATERNLSLEEAGHDWVFFLDSDEVIRSEDWPKIADLITRTDLDGVLVKRTDVFYDRTLRFGEAGSLKLLRLVRKKMAQFSRPVHEVASVPGKTISSDITLLHYSHQNISEFFSSISSYARIEAEYQQDDQLTDLALSLKTISYPKGKFLVNYLLKLGFLDGWRGLVYAMMMSLHSLMVRVFAYENR